MKNDNQLSLICKSLLLPFINPNYGYDDLLKKSHFILQIFKWRRQRKQNIF